MAAFARSNDLRGAEFHRCGPARRPVCRGRPVRCRDARRQCGGADIDDPFLCHGGSFLRVNGVDVSRRRRRGLTAFPRRAARRAEDPEGLRAAWPRSKRTWPATLARVAAMPAGTVDLAVGGECRSRRPCGTWSWPPTCGWAGQSSRPGSRFHPIGLLHAGIEEDGFDMSVFTTVPPTYAEVLEVRAGRVAMVRDSSHLTPRCAGRAPREPARIPDAAETVRSCLHVILHGGMGSTCRYAVRDLDAIDGRARRMSWWRPPSRSPPGAGPGRATRRGSR